VHLVVILPLFVTQPVLVAECEDRFLQRLDIDGAEIFQRGINIHFAAMRKKVQVENTTWVILL
jgi:hypothetical protein